MVMLILDKKNIRPDYPDRIYTPLKNDHSSIADLFFELRTIAIIIAIAIPRRTIIITEEMQQMRIESLREDEISSFALADPDNEGALSMPSFESENQ